MQTYLPHIQGRVSVREQLDYLEILVSESCQSNAKGLDDIRLSHDQLLGEMRGHREFAGRVSELEEVVRDLSEKHAHDLENSLEQIRDVQCRITEEQQAYDDHHDAFCKHHASVAERFAYVEKSIEDLSAQADESVEGLREKLTKMLQAERKDRGRCCQGDARVAEAGGGR